MDDTISRQAALNLFRLIFGDWKLPQDLINQLPSVYTGRETKYCMTCDHCDGAICTSLPPKIRCGITGEYHFLDASCDVEDDVIVHCNLKDNAETIAKILDADAEGKVWRGEENE